MASAVLLCGENKPHLLLRYEVLHDDIAHVLAVGIPVLKNEWTHGPVMAVRALVVRTHQRCRKNVCIISTSTHNIFAAVQLTLLSERPTSWLLNHPRFPNHHNRGRSSKAVYLVDGRDVLELQLAHSDRPSIATHNKLIMAGSSGNRPHPRLRLAHSGQPHPFLKRR